MALEMKRGDTAPWLQGVLIDKDQNPVNIQGAEIRIIGKHEGGEAFIDGAATNDQITNGEDGTMGFFHYEWQSGDTDQVGHYDLEFEVTFSNGEKQTFPTIGVVELNVTQDLG